MYRVEARGHTVRIYIGEKLVFRHSPDAPFAETGKGRWESFGNVVRDAKEGLTALTQAHYDAARSLLRFFCDDYSITFHISEHNGLLRLAPQRASTSLNRFRLRLPATPGTPVYGCGGQKSGELNLKGKKIHLWVGEHGVFHPNAQMPAVRMKGTPPLLPECPLPVFITGDSTGYIFETYGRAVFDFTATKTHYVSL